MTTEIIVKAHCSDEKEVEITITKNELTAARETSVIQNGEKSEVCVYDDMLVLIREVEKS